MDKPDSGLLEGDICFAHVRSFPWWPARIKSRIVKKSKISFLVIFFGTHETANLPEREVIPVNDESMKKCVTKGSVKRKFFKEGLAEEE